MTAVDGHVHVSVNVKAPVDVHAAHVNVNVAGGRLACGVGALLL